MTTPRQSLAGDAGLPSASSRQGPSLRLKLNLVGVAVLLIAFLGWLIAFQSTRRLAAERVPDRASETHSALETVTVALPSYATLMLLVLLGAVVLVNRNLKRQERVEARLQAALRAADAANDAKARFLATVSHEMRTPLNAISGMTQLLLDTRLDSEQTEHARTIHSNVEALTLLIGDLLDSSKIEAGQLALESLPFDVWELVEGVAEILIVRANIKGVELILDLTPDVPRVLVGDRNRLRQVLMNLVGNAVKFTEEGEVIVRVRSELSGSSRSVKLRFGVIDTGIGVAPEAQRRIFEPFVQADLSTVRRYGGTGLGLTISRSLVELMGGTLSLESEPGRGSTFDVEVTLPLADTQPAPEFNAASLVGLEVLLTKSNERARETIVQVLRSAGASVQAVATAAEAFDIVRRERRARVIVVGEHLQDSTALEFARAVSEASDSENGPAPGIVVLCSLYAMMTRYVGRYGISTCVYKPVKPGRLVQAVRQAAGLDAEAATPEAIGPPARIEEGAAIPARILLAEDHRDNQVLATRILVPAGYDIDLAEDGIRTVELAGNFRYDLILMDIAMPKMDGIVATRNIRERERASGQQPVPIVALTAHAVEEVRDEARAAGVNEYIAKPVRKQQLLEACARWIDPRPLVLLADDSPENHVLFANYLGQSDYRHVFVHNGRDAVAAFEHQRVWLVVLDLDMPIMDGYEAARAIRHARGGDIVPIVALTGYSGPEERQRCLEAGFSEYLSKPIDRAHLLAAIDGLLGRPVSRLSRYASAVGSPRSPLGQGGGSSTADAAHLPSGRESSDEVRRLLARRDFYAIVTLAKRLAATAKTMELNKLANVTEELADAARNQDEHRSAWWGDQLAPVLHEAQRLVEFRQHRENTIGGSYAALGRLATKLLAVPCAAVTLVDGNRLRLKGGSGTELIGGLELPLSRSIGGFVIARGSALLVEDARSDPRVREMEAVVSYGAASYGGVPLANAQGVTIGVFAVWDLQPRDWPPEDVAILEELAGIASWMLEMEHRFAEVATTKAESATTRPAQPGPTSGLPPVTVENDIADLIPAYVSSRREDLETLRSLLKIEDFDRIRGVGHNMKGSGVGYGLSEVTRIGAALERSARLGDAEALRNSIADMDAYLSRLSIRSVDGRVLVEP